MELEHDWDVGRRRRHIDGGAAAKTVNSGVTTRKCLGVFTGSPAGNIDAARRSRCVVTRVCVSPFPWMSLWAMAYGRLWFLLKLEIVHDPT